MATLFMSGSSVVFICRPEGLQSPEDLASQGEPRLVEYTWLRGLRRRSGVSKMWNDDMMIDISVGRVVYL